MHNTWEVKRSCNKVGVKHWNTGIFLLFWDRTVGSQVWDAAKWESERVLLPGVGVAVSLGGRRVLSFVRRCGRRRLRPRRCFRGVPEKLCWGRLTSRLWVLCRGRLRTGGDRDVLLVELGISLRIHWFGNRWFTIRLLVGFGLRRLSYLGIHSLGFGGATVEGGRVNLLC